MLNVSGGKFDLLQVWDGSKYINVADMLSALPELEDQIEADEARLQVLEDKVAALEAKLEDLGQVKAPLFIAVPPFF